MFLIKTDFESLQQPFGIERGNFGWRVERLSTAIGRIKNMEFRISVEIAQNF